MGPDCGMVKALQKSGFVPLGRMATRTAKQIGDSPWCIRGFVFSGELDWAAMPCADSPLALVEQSAISLRHNNGYDPGSNSTR